MKRKTDDMAAIMAPYERAGFEIRGGFPDDGEPTWLEVERDDVVVQFLAGETRCIASLTLTPADGGRSWPS